MKEFAAWLNDAAAGGAEGADKTNGDFLRAIVTNLAKAIIALLDALGEWPIEVE